MIKRRVSRRDFLSLSGVTAPDAIPAAGAPTLDLGAATYEDKMPPAEDYSMVYT